MMAMRREGELDPLSSQRPAFPLNNSNSGPAFEYLRSVREEARNLALGTMSARKGASANKQAASRPRAGPRAESQQLNYDDASFPLTEVLAVTNNLFGKQHHPPIKAESTQRSDKLASLYYSAYNTFTGLTPQHPEGCTSNATWKAYTAKHEPVPLDYKDSFRLYKNITDWCRGKPPQLHFVWAWSLLLRTPDLLESGEIATLRDLCRSMSKHRENPLAVAFIQVVGTVFGQADLLQS